MDKTYIIKITNTKTGEVEEHSTDCFVLSAYLDEQNGWNATGINAKSEQVINVMLHLDELQKELMMNLTEKDLKTYQYMRFGKLLTEIIGDTENDSDETTTPKNLC